MGAAVERCIRAQRENDDSRGRRPIVWPRDRHLRHEPFRRVHRPVSLQQYGFGRDTHIHAGSGNTGVSTAAANQSGVLEQQRHRLLERRRGDASCHLRHVDRFDAARSASRHDGRSRLQRVERHEPAGESAQYEPGAPVGDERPDREAGNAGGDYADEPAGEFSGGRCRRHQDSVRELHEPLDSDESKRRAGSAGVSAIQQHQHHEQRRRQDRQIHVSRRRAQGDAADDRRIHVPGQLYVFEADDQRRCVQRQHRLDGHGAARARVLDRALRSDAQHQAEHRARAAVGSGQTMAQRRRRAEPHPRRMADCGGAELRERAADRRDHRARRCRSSTARTGRT